MQRGSTESAQTGFICKCGHRQSEPYDHKWRGMRRGKHGEMTNVYDVSVGRSEQNSWEDNIKIDLK